MKKYVKKPVEIEAIQWDGDNRDEVAEFLQLDLDIDWEVFGLDNVSVFIATLEGTMKASIGDYIIKGIEGEFYPIKESIFLETYDKVTN